MKDAMILFQKRQVSIIGGLLILFSALSVFSLFVFVLFQTSQPVQAQAPPWPTTPPAEICGNNDILGDGPTSAPGGAVTVPAGDNSAFDFTSANTTYYFASGVHYLGTGEFDQIGPRDNTTFIGAPGAILDGQELNRYAFTGHGENVRIAYLEIRNFDAPRDEGVINHDSGKDWTIEYNYIHNNEGGAVFAGTDNTLQFNCIKDNGQYGFQAYSGNVDEVGPSNIVIDHNEVVGNNTRDWETIIDGCGCTGGSKFWLSGNVEVTNNWVHHNNGVGLWFDNNNRGSLVEHNYIEGNDGQGIFLEAGYDAQIRYNTLKENALETGKEFADRDDPFPIGAIYVSESGSPVGYGLEFVPTVISNNYFENNWGGVNLWENANRYSGSSAHTHVSGTIKIGDLEDDAACDGANDTIPGTITDKFDCRWSTENVIVEDNEFHINKAAIGAGCAGENFCGISGIFANVGSYPEFSGFLIPGRITFQQGNIFRNNEYHGDWHFAGFETTTPEGLRVSWDDWTAPAASIPAEFDVNNRPTTFGQDQGSTISGAPTPSPTPTPTSIPTPTPARNALDVDTETIEGSLGHWQSWFSDTISRSAEQAHTGSYSLRVNVTDPFGWGVQLNNSPGFLTTPGQKTLSFWGLLGAGNTNATLSVKWIDDTDSLLQTDTLTISPLTSSWKEATKSATAPIGTKYVYLTIDGDGDPGDYFYFDDFIVADVTPTPTPTNIPTPTPVGGSSESSSSDSSSSPSNGPPEWKYLVDAGPKLPGVIHFIPGEGEAADAKVLIGKDATSIDLSVSIVKTTPEMLLNELDSNPFPWMQGLNTAGEIYNFKSVSAFNGYPMNEMDKPVTIIVPYDPARLFGTDPRRLRIAWYDINRGVWRVLNQNTVLNVNNHTLANTTTHMTYFAVVYPTRTGYYLR